jgi:hypothetical protein
LRYIQHALRNINPYNFFGALRIDSASKAKSPVPVATSSINFGLILLQFVDSFFTPDDINTQRHEVVQKIVGFGYVVKHIGHLLFFGALLIL